MMIFTRGLYLGPRVGPVERGFITGSGIGEFLGELLDFSRPFFYLELDISM